MKVLPLIGTTVLAFLLDRPRSTASELGMVGNDTEAITNRALLIVSKLRGVEPAAVTLRLAGRRTNGPWEIDITGVADSRREAEELSRQLGSKVVVVLNHASAEGTSRTNWSFRNGVGEQRIAPTGPTGLGPGAKRMYFWPEAAAPAAPRNLRIHAPNSAHLKNSPAGATPAN